jgi:hypothetical protein
MLSIITTVAVLGALDAMALKYGAESRPGFEQTHRR